MTLTVIGWKLSLKVKNFNSLLEYLFKGVHCTPFSFLNLVNKFGFPILIVGKGEIDKLGFVGMIM